MDRRAFLKTTGVTAGVLAAGGLLAACGGSTFGDQLAAGGDVSNPEGAAPTWNLINAQFELLTGDAQRFAFALTQIDNTPIEATDIEVYTRDVSGEVLGGPFPVEAFAADDVGLPIYRTEIDVAAPGRIEVIAVRGDDFGSSVANAVAPADSAVPVPGSQAISVATPTTEEELALEELCTRRPEDCSMHAVSLEEALEAGRPVVLMFATPAYCQTAVCGPAVDTMQQVADSRDWGDVAFIHAEIYSDAGITVAEHVTEWGLPSEPWLFTIDRDGAIAARLDGPMIADELMAVTEALA
jgi:hypothetical protein